MAFSAAQWVGSLTKTTVRPLENNSSSAQSMDSEHNTDLAMASCSSCTCEEVNDGSSRIWGSVHG